MNLFGVPRQVKGDRTRWTLEARLLSGLVLMAYVLTHFVNHMLGLVSLDAMERGREGFNLLWRSAPGTVLLYGALLVHFGLALYALHRRRTLRMPPREAMQLALGLSIPFLLLSHVVGARGTFEVAGIDRGYREMVRSLYVEQPINGLRQTIAMGVVWIHGCLGVHFWLRPKRWYPRASLLLYSAALLIPLLAQIGVLEAGKDAALAVVPSELASRLGPEAADRLETIRMALGIGFAASIVMVLGARGIRSLLGRATQVRITYPGGKVVAVPRGFSVLEASRLAGLPHVAACGGRGRCSTCRIGILEGLEGQPRPGPRKGRRWPASMPAVRSASPASCVQTRTSRSRPSWRTAPSI